MLKVRAQLQPQDVTSPPRSKSPLSKQPMRVAAVVLWLEHASVLFQLQVEIHQCLPDEDESSCLNTARTWRGDKGE